MTLAEAAVAAEIRGLVREELRVPDPFSDDEELAARLDSMLLIALVTAVEDRFRIVITEEDAAGTRTLSQLAALVVRRQDARVGSGDTA